MPINELERHPFLNYLDNEIDPNIEYTGLIIGSFPIYSCTDTINNNLEIIEQRFIPNDVTMRFFYCSNKSKFWEYCSSAHGEDNPTNKILGETIDNGFINSRQRTIDFLSRNKLLITDVIYQTNRNQYGDEDSNLWKIEGANQQIINSLSLNHRIPDILKQNTSINNLYFTARGLTGNCPFGWFKNIFGNNFVINQEYLSGLNISINGKKYKAFLLPTPKPRGIHYTDNQRNKLFENYLMSMDAAFYNVISNLTEANRSNEHKERLKTLRHNFLVESYRQAFIENNLAFDGTIIIN